MANYKHMVGGSATSILLHPDFLWGHERCFHNELGKTNLFHPANVIAISGLVKNDNVRYLFYFSHGISQNHYRLLKTAEVTFSPRK